MNKKGFKLVRPNSLRKQAEKALAEKPGKARETKVENLERLVHELQVHQIELEMQNDELRRAQEEIAESQSKYADLYDFAPVGYLTLDQKGLIKELNLTGARLLGVGRKLLMGKSFSLFVASEAREVFDQHRTRLIKTGEKQTSELSLKRKGGARFFARLESLPATTNEGDTVWRTVITDITEQKRAESQSWLTAIVESSNDAIIGKTPDGAILSWNRGAERLYGYTSNEAIGRSISILAPPGHQDEIAEILRRIRSGEPVNHFETVRMKKDGTRVDVSLTISPLRNAEGTIIGASSIAHDVTERKQAENEREAAVRFLRFVNEANTKADMIRAAVTFFQEQSGCEAVGIRLKEEEGYPYCETIGFPGEHILAENELCVRDETGRVIHDHAGNPVMACMCGAVISGRFDPPKPFFTAGGNFWTNSTTDFLATTNEADRQGNTRNRCNREGYESVALIALRVGEETMGLLQLNDRQKGRFSAQGIALWERLAGYLAIAVAKFEAEEALRKAHDGLEHMVAERTAELTKALAALTAEARELDRARVDLEESETRYRGIVETAEEGIWTTDADAKTSFVNPKMAQMLGYTVEEMMAKPVFAFVDEDGRAIVEAKIERRRKGIKEQYDFTFRHKDGTTVWTMVSANPIFDEHGKYMGALRMVTDITNRLALEQQLRQAHKMEAIGTLAGGIAHDFNNILAAIVGFTEMALDDAPEGSLMRRSMERVLSAGLRGRDLVKRILTFSRRGEQERRQVALIPLAQETLRFLRASLPATIDIQFDSRSETDLVFADPTQIEQVLMNLVTNGAHAMGEKGGILEIELSDALFSSPSEVPERGMQPGPYVKLSVRDIGCGMEKLILDRIFDPFFTTKQPGDGTGLGLSVVHGIVKSHQGAITVSSKPGKGSTFSVYLPKAHVPMAQENAETTSIKAGHERILFVDDEKDIAEAGKAALQGLGYQVTVTRDSAEALLIFRQAPDLFDLVVTDQTMPRLTGTELAREVLSIRPDIPVILCTGYSDVISPDKAKAAGIRAYIMKPVTRREMAAVVERVLEGRRESSRNMK